MSFAEDVKNEIAHYETTDERVRRAGSWLLLCIGGTVLHGTADSLRQDWNSALPIMP